MPVWSSPTVDIQRPLTLRDWTVLELLSGSRHVIGHCVESRVGRVSTAVVDLDFSGMCATTESGRVYVLQGHPGFSEDGFYVWRRFRSINSIVEFVDVSAAVWAAHLERRRLEQQGQQVSDD